MGCWVLSGGFILLVVLFCAPIVSGAEAWRRAGPDYEWNFPEDHWARDGYKMEWWYFTGHLRSVDPPVRRFGYQFTFFRVGVLPSRPVLNSEWATKDVIMGHAALTDLDSGQHWFSELIVRATPFLGGFGRYPDPLLVWSVGPPGTSERWQLRWNGDGFDFSMADAVKSMGFSLSTHPGKSLVFQGPGGLSKKGEGAMEASQYYSFTRLATRGTVSVGGQQIAVTGVSWMDKEFGSNQLGKDKSGWDWFSLQLDDGREIMLYLLRSRSGKTDYASGTVVGITGEVRYLGSDDWQLHITREWTSRTTGSSYPAGWTLQIPEFGIIAVITPEVADQENRSRLIADLNYWEGSVSIESTGGERIGQGYAELTGYGERSRPPI
jgi:predicted secreted hydrolase